MKIALIGGSGFIGSHLCSVFQDFKIDFSIYDKLKSKNLNHKCIVGDILDMERLTNFIEDDSIIINLAAEHQDNVRPRNLYYSTNVQGAVNICNVARVKNVRMIIFTSSVAVYGFSNICVDESFDTKPSTDYGISKLQAEFIYKEWQLEDPLNRVLVIIRPTVVFGEGNRGNVYKLFKQIVSKKFIFIGNGRNIKSLAYVGNLVFFILYSLKINKGVHIFNYVDKPDYSIDQLVNEIYYNLGYKKAFILRIPFYIGVFIGYLFDFLNLFFKFNSSINSHRIKKFCSNSLFDSIYVKDHYSPLVSLSTALKKTISYEFPENIE